MRRKTRLMLEAEARLGRPLEEALPQMVTEQGQTAVAKQLGISKATLGYWLLKLGIEVRRYCVGPRGADPNGIEERLRQENDRLRFALEAVVGAILKGEMDDEVLQRAIGALQASEGAYAHL